MIIIGTPQWHDFLSEAEVVTTFEAKDGPHLVNAIVLRGNPDSDASCTLYVSARLQDPAPSPTVGFRDLGPLLRAKLDHPEEYEDEILEVRGTFLEGVKPGAMQYPAWAEEHPSIGSAVLRLAALSHANATGRLLGELDARAGLGVLQLLTVESGVR